MTYEIKSFVDDSKLLQGFTTENNCKLTQEALDWLQQWATNGNLIFHPKKCMLLKAGRRDPDFDYRQISIIRHTFISNKIVSHSDVVGASPVGAAPTTSSFST